MTGRRLLVEGPLGPSAALDPRPVLLTVRALGLGDLLLAVPAVRALRTAFPAHRHVLATDARLSALAFASGAVDEVADVRAVHDPRQLALLPALMANRRVDVVANLHGRGPQSHRCAKAVRPRRIVAFGRYEMGVAGPTWLPFEHEVDRWLRLVSATTGMVGSREDFLLPQLAHPEREDLVVVHPGASDPAECWPVQRFGWVAARLRAAGHQVVVTGSAAEHGLAERVAAAAGLPPRANLAGRTDVAALARLVGRSSLTLSGDTGVAHVAWATHTPSVRLHGPSAPRSWAPRTGPHDVLVSPGRRLADLTVGEVLEACEARLAAGAAPERPIDLRAHRAAGPAAPARAERTARPA